MSVFPERPITRHGIHHRFLTVDSATRLPGDFVRVVLRGEDVTGFTSTGPTDHAKLTIDPDGEAVGRHFTPINLSDDSISFDIHLHGAGPISTWAEKLPVGDAVKVSGPRSSKGIPAGLTKLILVADSAAFPPLARWLDSIADKVEVHIVLIDDNETYFGDLSDYNYSVVTDENGEAILKAVQDIGVDSQSFVWAAGESTRLIPLRRWLRHDTEMNRSAIAIQGYWKRGVADLDHHAPVDPSDVDQ